jgi:Fe-S cluster assembly protein SufD
MNRQALKKIQTGGYVEAYGAAAEGLLSAGLAWLKPLQGEAIEAFAAAGFPSRQSEEWRYTSLAPLTARVFSPAPGGVAAKSLPKDDLLLGNLKGLRLVFVNGRFSADLSKMSPLPGGLDLQWISALPKAGTGAALQLEAGVSRPMKALNTAFLMDGLIIQIAPGAEIAEPIEIHHLMTPEAEGHAAHLHHVVMAGENSSATVIESFSGEGAYWANIISDVEVGSGARLQTYKIVHEGAGGIHLAESDVRLGDRAHYSNFALLTGGETLRNEIRLKFEGDHAECHLAGAYLAGQGQSHEVVTLVDHAMPDNISRQNYRGVLGAGAHTAFQGKVVVRPDAQRTNAGQSNHNLVLDRSADANTKPELEIYADDVKCSHGATVGELDPNMMFYLQSRGLDEGAARHMLVEAFIASLIDDIPAGFIQDLIRQVAVDALAGVTGRRS